MPFWWAPFFLIPAGLLFHDEFDHIGPENNDEDDGKNKNHHRDQQFL
jgi:hypothetical protein